jgi:chromosomal replication initiation ATPase DnaA
MSNISNRRAARDRQSDQDLACAEYAAHLVALAFGVSVEAIFDGGREVEAVRARQIAMYLTHIGNGLSLARVGVAFGRDRATVGYAIHRVETWRDDPAFDARLLSLEHAVRSAPAARFP